MTEFRLPGGIAEEGAEGFVVNWFKDEGQPVREGELLLEVQFEKVTSEVYAPADGVLGRILAPQGEPVKPGQPLCLILPSGAPALAPAPREVRASPAAKRLARELGVALEQVPGSGPAGRITEEDVQRAARAAGPAAPARREALTLSPAQRLAGERMLQSLRETAQFTLTREVEVSLLAALREQARSQGSPVSLSDLLHRAVVLALADYPRMQAELQGDQLVLPESIHLGFAVARNDDLLVPVIRDAWARTLPELAAERLRLTAAVLEGTATPADFAGATFTVSNLGVLGVDAFTPVLNPPQPAILGVGRVADRPVVLDGEVVAGKVITLSLTVDHRVINGAPAARFLERLANLLSAPEGWADL